MANVITYAPTSPIHAPRISPHLPVASKEAHWLLGLKGPASRSAG